MYSYLFRLMDSRHYRGLSKIHDKSSVQPDLSSRTSIMRFIKNWIHIKIKYLQIKKKVDKE